jgi:hypothetical protein
MKLASSSSLHNIPAYLNTGKKASINFHCPTAAR